MTAAFERDELIFRRKKDLYLISALAYVIFGVAYVLVTSALKDPPAQVGFRDPVVYLIIVFILLALGMLLANVIRDRRLVITPQRIVFRSRFREKVIFLQHIMRIDLLRETPRLNRGVLTVVKLTVANRRRKVRIRVANYERENDLLQALKQVKESLKK